ncbi:YfiR family protein [Litorivivens sp.]|uniref:YfiR family protein n=1 Tax=Litorivivens sp. TaxID=2020868 RepID=UPI00356736FE
MRIQVRRGLSVHCKALFLSVVISVTVGHVLADNSDFEYRVKSAFLYHFFKFVEWPTSPSTTGERLIICTIGSPRLHDSLQQTLVDKYIRGRPIELEMIASPAEAQACSIVFLGFDNPAKLDEWVGQLSSVSALTVSDTYGFAGRGGMIEFVVVSGKIRFDINHSAANRLDINLSSKLLTLARKVY